MYNWQCTNCGYMTESERCPSCKYANCRGCHIIEYANKPPLKCPSCSEHSEFIDLDVVEKSNTGA
jgi:rubrerythrin